MPIGDAVGRLLRARGLEATVVLADVASCWEETVGGDVAAHVSPVALRQGELVVEVDEPAWATQVQLLSNLLCSRLADLLGPGVVRRVSVRVARPGRGSAAQVSGAAEGAEFGRKMPGRTHRNR